MPERPEDHASECSLQRGHDDVALDRRADHDGELFEERMLRLGAQWARVLDARLNSQADDEIRRVLTDVDRLTGQEAAAGHKPGGQSLLQPGEEGMPIAPMMLP